MLRLINNRPTYESKKVWTIFLDCFSTDLGLSGIIGGYLQEEVKNLPMMQQLPK